MNQVSTKEVAVIEQNGKETINARDLHENLGLRGNFANWMQDWVKSDDLKEGVDYTRIDSNKRVNGNNGGGAVTTKEYFVFIEIAKLKAASSRTIAGKQIVKQLIARDTQRMEQAALTSSRLDRIEALLETVASAVVQLQVQDIKSTKNSLLEEHKPVRKRTRFTVREYFNEYYRKQYNNMTPREEYIIAECCLMLCREFHNMDIKVARGEDIREISYPAAQLESAFISQRGRTDF